MTPNDPKMIPKLSEKYLKNFDQFDKKFDQNGTKTMPKSLKNN